LSRHLAAAGVQTGPDGPA